MSWKVMDRGRAVQSKTGVAVAMSGIATEKAKTCLVLRPPLLTSAAWLTAGTSIVAFEGEGEHAGLLRIEANELGEFALAKAGGKRNASTLMVFLPWPDGARPSKQSPQAVKYEIGKGWLVVTLPAWARAPAPVKPVDAPPPPPAGRATVRGYEGISARVPDPAAADRMGARRAGGL